MYVTHRSGHRYNKFCKILQLKYGRIHPKAFRNKSRNLEVVSCYVYICTSKVNKLINK